MTNRGEIIKDAWTEITNENDQARWGRKHLKINEPRGALENNHLMKFIILGIFVTLRIFVFYNKKYQQKRSFSLKHDLRRLEDIKFRFCIITIF